MSDLLNKLGASMLLSQDELMKLIRSAPRRYKVYRFLSANQENFV